MRQEFRLHGWRWDVTVFYEAGPRDVDEILAVLEDIGCQGDKLKDARDTILSGERNFGVTYSNYQTRASVVVIGRTSSAAEFQNSYDHEKGHLVKHICQALHISPWGEEAEYLAGTIGQKTFVYARHLLCEQCRRRLAN